MARLLHVVALLAAFALAAANSLYYLDPVTGTPSADGPRTVVLPSYGETSISLSFFLKGAEAKSSKVSAGKLYKHGRIITSKYKDATNYTIPFVFDKSVGTEAYTFSVETSAGRMLEISGRFVVAGVVIMEKGVVVSGDDGVGVSVGSTGKYSYDVKAVGTDGAAADLSDVKISYKEMAGVYMKEVKTSSIDTTTFTMELNPYRVGTGNFMVNFECPSITKDGESFETVLNVKQRTNPAPPCVVVGGDVKMTSTGLVTIPMYNLEKPPQAKAITAVVLSVGGKTFEYMKSASGRSIPDQTMVFKPTVLGPATVTCDGEAAKIVGGGSKLTLTGTLPKGPVDALAVDNVQALEASSKYATFTAVVRIIPTSPAVFLAKDAQAMVDEVRRIIGSSKCVYEKIMKGSVVMNVAAHIPKGDTSAEGKLRNAVSTGAFQKKLGYAKDDVVLEKTNVIGAKVVAAGSVAGSAVLATWTIVLIAVVGAFAIILLIMLALWAVYRRNAEQSESDYSSSGPLGVPDPSDLLYEQSIVRDIYGRGDFPEGGPSQAAAAAREREADLREEFPRQPSSSDVSRGAATDDASSTYSV